VLYAYLLLRIMKSGGTDDQMVLSTVGAAYGTAKAGIGIAGLGTFRSAD
jgi:hypothetical protein